MKVEIVDNRINITDNDGIIFKNLFPVFKYDGGNYNVLSVYPEGRWIRKIKDGFTVVKCENFEYRFEFPANGIKINLVFTADKNYDNPLSLDSVNCFYKHGIKTCLANTFDNFNNLRCNAMCSTVDTLSLVDGQVAESGDNIFLEDENNIFLAVGTVTFNRYFTEQRVLSDGTIRFLNKMEVRPLKKGEKIAGECCYIGFDDTVFDVISRYTDVCIKTNNIIPSRFNKPSGFCTWYYYGKKINQSEIYENLDFFYKNKELFPIEYIQIDDGWENNRGDWKENEKFPDGMKKIACAISEKGFKPGIWLAPFKVDEQSELFKRHPDFLVRNTDGSLFKGFDGACCLDFSNKEACRYIYELFYNISHRWGFRYIKIDLINISVPPLLFKDTEFTALKNIRKGMEIINGAVTKDTFILACTSPLMPLMGLCDGMRVSVDIFERWESLKEVFKSVFKRYYFNDRFFYNDADCLIMRKAENEDSECWRFCVRTDPEIKTYITAMAASGGIFMIGDKLMNFKDSQLELLSKIFPLNTKAAVPLDIMESDIPSVLDFGYIGKNRIVAFFNWSEKEKEYSFLAGDNMQAFEFWDQKYYGIKGKDMKIKVLPHNVKLFYFSSPVHPCAVGTNDAIIADINQNYTRKMLRCRFIKNGEIQFVATDKKMFCPDDAEIKEDRVGERYLYRIKNINNIPGYSLVEK